MSDTSFTPAQNPDLSTIDPATIGVDTSITTQFISERAQPFSVDPTNVLSIGKPMSFTSGITVSGVINNSDLQNKLNDKANVNDVYTKTYTDSKFQSINNSLVGYQTITGMTSYATLASPTFTGTVSGITKAMVGLGNVENTSDASKPISTATQTALNLKANTADVAANYQHIFEIAASISSTGTINRNNLGAAQNITSVNKSGTGQYVINWATGIGTTYGVLVSARGAGFYASYFSTNTTSVQVNTYSGTALADTAFTIIIMN